MKKALDLSFEVIKQTILAQNSAGCKTNGSSGCCTTYCTTRACQKVDPENEVEALKKEKAKGEINDWKNAFVQKGDKQLLVKRTSLDAGSVKDIIFQLKKEIPNSVTIVISDAGEKPMITVGVSADLEANYHAGNIVKELAKEIQGGGGGNPGFATAGGKNLAGIENALNKAMEI